jgi:protoporphyrinogen oxidase
VSQTYQTDVAIIGAGPAGLTAAYLLAKAGKKAVVLEADPVYVGGISRTAQYKGYRFDIGGHRFFSKSKEVVDFWREILPDDFIDRPRLSRIYYNGKFYNYPLSAIQALINLGPITSSLCMLSYFKWKFFPVKEPKNFRDWVSNQFGKRLFNIFFKTYTEKVWGMACEEISADWAAQRIKGLSLSKAVLDGFKRNLRFGRKPKSAIGKDGKVVKTLIDNFSYPRLGPGMMWETARDKFIAMGGIVQMGSKATQISLDRATGLWTVTGSDGTTILAKDVISTAPIRELMSNLTPPPASLSDAQNLKYRDFLTVALMLDVAVPFKDNWIYIHDPSVKVGRIQNFRSWSPELLPDASTSCLGLEYFCFEGDGLWTMADTDLIALATRELQQLGLTSGGKVIDGCVVRQPKAYPVYDDAYKAHVSAVQHEVEANYPGLHLVGRNGMHRYNNQDHSMMTAMLTVRNILAGQRVYDIWNVNEDAEYHEGGNEGEKEALSSVRMVPEKVK